MKKIFLYASVLITIFVLITERSQAQWLPDSRMTNALGDSRTSNNNAKCIKAYYGNIVHTVWYDYRDGNMEIYYKRSSDGGVSWGPDVRLTNNPSTSINPSIDVYGLNVHVVWQDDRNESTYEIYHKRSTDGGITWGADTRITNTPFESWNPSVVIIGIYVIVVFTDLGSSVTLNSRRSTDNGLTWSVHSVFVSSSEANYGSLAYFDFLTTHLVWLDNRHGNNEIYYKRSTDAGNIWETEIRLTNNPAESYAPAISTFGQLVHVTWSDERDGSAQIYYKRSTDYGMTWGADTRLTKTFAYSGYPTIAAWGQNVHIVWYDARDGNFEIYYKHSTDGGVSWEADTRLTNNASDSWNPFIAVYDSKVHVIWQDNRDGNHEIYYKGNPTGNVGIRNISAEVPSEYSLSQNFPNPFNPKTKIRFDVIRSPIGSFGDDKVLLKVFDVAGREVETLVNEQLAPGTYEATFDASKLNSGVYFYRLQTGSFTETKRMMLVK